MSMGYGSLYDYVYICVLYAGIGLVRKTKEPLPNFSKSNALVIIWFGIQIQAPQSGTSSNLT